MKATVEYIERKFEEFNRLMFSGRLKPVAIQLTPSRRSLGKVRYLRDKDFRGRYSYRDIVILISSRFDFPERLLDDTIIHEMIHYWILSNQMNDTSTHGEIFTAKMLEINKRFNCNISVSHKFTDGDYGMDSEIRQHLICISEFNTGKLGITIASKSRIFELWEVIPNIPNVVKCNWFISYDPYYNRYPRALTAKVYKITKDDLCAHKADFKPLVKMADKIVVARQ